MSHQASLMLFWWRWFFKLAMDMEKSELTITVEQNSQDLAEKLESELLLSLAGELEQSLNTSFTLFAKNSNGDLIGGLVASISYSWLLVKILWVEESQRNSGIGRSLVDAAEVIAKGFDSNR